MERKSIWRDAAQAGAVVGLVVTAALFLRIWLSTAGTSLGGLVTLAEIAMVVWLIFKYSVRRGSTYAPGEYSFAQSMGYILLMMVFAGFVYGMGLYLLVNYVSPGYTAGLFEATFDAVRDTMSPADADAYIASFNSVLGNPIYLSISGIIAMLFYGGVAGIFASAFVRRKLAAAPQPKTKHDDDE